MTVEAVFKSLSSGSVKPAAHTYRPEIDGLRAVAVLPVLLFHAGLAGFENGYLGVDIFFVISGYLITGILLDERRRTGKVSFISFYERRLRRILPALAVVVTASAAAAWFVLTPVRMEEFSKSVISAFTFSANFWFLAQTHYFSTATDEQPLIHLWSLGVEEQFYVALPLLVLLTNRIPEKALFVAIGVLGVASLLLSELVSAASPDAAFYRPDTRAWELLAGAACAFLASGKICFPQLLAAAGAALIALSLFVLPGPGLPNFLAVPVCLGTALVLLSATGASGIGRILAAPGITHIGLISYSLYLWHQPLLALARVRQMAPLSTGLTCMVLAICVVLASATWYFVERPFRDRSRTDRKTVVACSAFAASALVGFGAAGSGDGYAFRYGELKEKYFASVDVIDDLQSTKSKAIRMGICHFRADRSPPLDRFLEDWNCRGSASGADTLVVGDSHAADKAAALRLNGIDIAQMTGAGCSVVPSLMSRDCRRLFDKVVAEYTGFHRVDRLIIANKQLPNIYTRQQVAEAIKFWQPLGARIFWFSDMPQFTELEDRKAQNILARGDASSGAFPSTLDEARRNYAYMVDLEHGQFTAVDSASLFCSLSECQPFVKSRGWIASPYGHLTAIGAYLFGQKLLQHDPTFRS
ncbi:acyltransferase family protein [Mesorhizobium huakuii]|uniref:Acyltransferase n=1 Tax=Mesorhizobium huakuii TaxID=28104 RepID=A0A7G6T093_9HYPH|nr:acyltransferase family protein [Mesorhizobium huakuii]QND60175.1 acyltransferase [Mesorhizobium huakuii]